MSVLVFGATSLVGSHFVEESPVDGAVRAAGRTDPAARGLRVRSFDRVDLAEERDVREFLRSTDADVWVNFAARTDVDGCERERSESVPPISTRAGPGSAWRTNAELPGWLAEEARDSGRYLVHLSTDFVFDGQAGPYAEDAEPSPLGPRIGWYGYTKGAGERAVRAACPTSAVVRIAYPFRARFAGRSDFARTLLERRESGTLYPLYTDQRITPTWIPDVSAALRALARHRPAGTFHVASPEVTTPYDFAVALFRATEPGSPGAAPVPPGRLATAEAVPGRAPRPLHGGLRVDAIRALGVRPLGYRDAIRALADELRAGSPAGDR